MTEEQLRPKWVGIGSVIFGLVVVLGLAGGVGTLLWHHFGPKGPSANETFFGTTLPRWWIARAKSKPTKVDIYAELPDPALEEPLRRIEASFPDAAGVAAEAIGLNEAIRQAKLPYWIDVSERRGFPVIMSFEVQRRDEWRVGDELAEVLLAARVDHTNVVAAFSGKMGGDSPVVLVDSLERVIIHDLSAKPTKNPVEKLRHRWRTAWAEARSAPGATEAAREALAERERAILKLERGPKRNLRVDRPERFRLPISWTHSLKELTELDEGPGVLRYRDLHRVIEVSEKLMDGPSGQALEALLELDEDVGSAHEAFIALDFGSADAPSPPELERYHEGGSESIRRGAKAHLRAGLGAIRYGRSPPCAALLRMLRAAAGDHVRYTAWHYGSMAAIHMLMGEAELEPVALAEWAEEICEDPEALRASAGAALERLGVPAATLVSGKSDES